MSHTPSIKIKKIHEAWATKNGYRLKGASFKRQAARPKHQAASSKAQAPSS